MGSVRQMTRRVSDGQDEGIADPADRADRVVEITLGRNKESLGRTAARAGGEDKQPVLSSNRLCRASFRVGRKGLAVSGPGPWHRAIPEPLGQLEYEISTRAMPCLGSSNHTVAGVEPLQAFGPDALPFTPVKVVSSGPKGSHRPVGGLSDPGVPREEHGVDNHDTADLCNGF